MKATDLLKKQHRQVERLFTAALKGEPAKQSKAVGQIITQLTAHAEIEESIFYPAFKGDVGTKKGEELTLEAYEEHNVIKFILGELPTVDPGDETFEAKVTVLKEIVAHHVEEEEGEMFPAAEKKLGAEKLEELGAQMQAAMEEHEIAPPPAKKNAKANGRSASPGR